MSAELKTLADEFNRYFTSANGVDVGERVNVSRDEWRTLYAALARTQQPEQVAPEDVRRDAERYRWLRAKENQDNDVWNTFGPYSSAQEIDAAIDAAIESARAGREG